MINIKLADIPVQMNNQFPDLEYLCRDYMTDEAPELQLSVTREELEKERSMQSEIFSDGYLETVCLYRKLALEAIERDVFVLHASVLEVDGEGYAFLARSGTGKTTQTRLWLEYFGDRARVVNGDKPLIRMIKKEDRVEGVVYEISDNFGAFVAVDNQYSGLIAKKELFGNVKVGDRISARVVSVKEDGEDILFESVEDDAVFEELVNIFDELLDSEMDYDA